MGRYKKRRRKRSSKLADKRINTLFEKRAKEIAVKEVRKSLVKYVHVSQIKDSAYNWTSTRSLPLLDSWEHWDGTAQDTNFPYKVISDIGGNVEFANMVNLDAAGQQQCEVRIHGIQVYGVVANVSTLPTRMEVRLVYIPNVNTYTQGSVDYLVPRATMLYKSGAGVGNLLRRGYDRRSLTTVEATGLPFQFTTLARKVFHLKPTVIDGFQEVAGTEQDIQIQLPADYRRFSMSKYFKNPKKAFIRGTSGMLTNGNYYLCYWSDSPLTSASFAILATTNLQYSMKAPMGDDLD